MIVTLDTPFYENAANGERMITARVIDFRRKYGISEALACGSRYLTFKDFQRMMRSLDLKWCLHPAWPGLRRKYEEFRRAFARRRVAHAIPVVVEKREE